MGLSRFQRAATHHPMALLGLRGFKRDLKTLGLSEAQIHQIIPDAGARRADGTSDPTAGTPPPLPPAQ